MKTLFIDTSFSDVSIAILKDNKIISSIQNNIPNEHSIYAHPYIEKVLKDSNTLPKEIDEIIVGNGPGSFTGVRIGLTIAKVYAYLENIPVTLISSLKTLALSEKGEYILSLIDARNDNYYLGLYDKNYNDVIKEQFTNIKEVQELLNEYSNIKIVTNSKINLDNYQLITNINIENIVNYYQDKEQVNAHQVLPNYLKLPQVLEKWLEK